MSHFPSLIFSIPQARIPKTICMTGGVGDKKKIGDIHPDSGTKSVTLYVSGKVIEMRKR